jgi:5-methylcytosine-specific restriction protein A
VKDKKTEKHTTKSTVANIQGGERKVVRREGQLVTAFEDHLTEAGHTFKSFQITVKGETSSFVPDLYDVTDNVLYEAKGTASRNAVRLAIGQLLDYRRHLQVPDGLRLAVLLPEAPSDDVRDLLAVENIALVTRTSDGFDGFPLA